MQQIGDIYLRQHFKNAVQQVGHRLTESFTRLAPIDLSRKLADNIAYALDNRLNEVAYAAKQVAQRAFIAEHISKQVEHAHKQVADAIKQALYQLFIAKHVGDRADCALYKPFDRRDELRQSVAAQKVVYKAKEAGYHRGEAFAYLRQRAFIAQYRAYAVYDLRDDFEQAVEQLRANGGKPFKDLLDVFGRDEARYRLQNACGKPRCGLNGLFKAGSDAVHYSAKRR